MTPAEKERHAAAMRLRSIDRRLRKVRNAKYPNEDARKEALRKFWEAAANDKRTKKGNR